MIRFECDYAEGAHPRVLEILSKTNFEQTPGYGVDIYCEKAREIIKEQCQTKEAEVHFLVGGTQTNTTVIASILRPHQGVLCADIGHINVHETGAIEATGHKVLALPNRDGKIKASQVKAAYDTHWKDSSHEHVVQPGMVYISNPTENGTLYSKAELVELSKVCKECNLPLFLDGARLGYGLMAESYDVTLSDIANCCDVFYIGGTKVGALFGEALVIVNKALQKDFRYFIKQNGGMLAKGRLLGLQFIALFEDGLYYEVSKKADELALRIKAAFASKGISFLYDSITNQQFPILTYNQMSQLEKKYAFTFWGEVDELHSAVRFCTSWATKEEDIEKLVADIEQLS
jgi:threonine aldolase